MFQFSTPVDWNFLDMVQVQACFPFGPIGLCVLYMYASGCGRDTSRYRWGIEYWTLNGFESLVTTWKSYFLNKALRRLLLQKSKKKTFSDNVPKTLSKLSAEGAYLDKLTTLFG